MTVTGRNNEFAGTHLHTYVERGTVRVKCLAQEDNMMSSARAPSGDKRTHEATSHLTGKTDRSIFLCGRKKRFFVT